MTEGSGWAEERKSKGGKKGKGWKERGWVREEGGGCTLHILVTYT